MCFGYTVSELIVLALAVIILLWSLFNIITSEKHTSKFPYWLALIAVIFAVWAWRSGNGLAFYHGVKHFIGTP